MRSLFENDIYTWDSPSKNAEESMPLGGCGLGLNVWVEDGELLFYFQQTGAYDEHSAFLKMGRVRCLFGKDIFLSEECSFKQELNVRKGAMVISASDPHSGEIIKISLWVDVFDPVVHINFESSKAQPLKVIYENWRYEDKVSPAEHSESYIFGERNDIFDFWMYPENLIRHKDNINFSDNTVVWFHQNDNDDLAFDKNMNLQGYADTKELFYNSQKDLIFGGMVVGAGMRPGSVENGSYLNTPYKSYSLVSESEETSFHIAVHCLKGKYPTADDWATDLAARVSAYNAVEHASKLEATEIWWEEFWQQSWIEINPREEDVQLSEEVRQVSRNYRLFRFMQGANINGTDPVKFNGGMFTYDSDLVKYIEEQRNISYLENPRQITYHDEVEIEASEKLDVIRDYGPDYRAWGGGSLTLQNQRLLYWPLLKTGDFSLMTSQFDWFPRVLDAAKARTTLAWGHGGCCYTEQISECGLPIGSHYGWERPDELGYGDQISPSCMMHYSTQLEFSYMIVLFHIYSGRDISEYMPFVENSTEFFFEHYEYWAEKQGRDAYDENGQLIIFPSTALESYKDATNPNDVTCALYRIYESLLKCDFISDEQRSRYEDRLAKVPPVTFREMEGKKVIAPAKDWSYVNNVELPQMYPVFPYRFYGINKPDLQVAIDTWEIGSVDRTGQKSYASWHQDGVFCAQLGLVDEAKEILICKLADGGRKFPAFWGPGHDWCPDFNWGGTGMIQLQDMLMQTDDDQILILPCWPKEWDVNFKLHAPRKTVVECEYRDGVVVSLKVTPESRAKDVVVIPMMN